MASLSSYSELQDFISDRLYTVVAFCSCADPSAKPYLDDLQQMRRAIKQRWPNSCEVSELAFALVDITTYGGHNDDEKQNDAAASQICAKFNLRSLPTVIIFHYSHETERFDGVETKWWQGKTTMDEILGAVEARIKPKHEVKLDVNPCDVVNNNNKNNKNNTHNNNRNSERDGDGDDDDVAPLDPLKRLVWNTYQQKPPQQQQQQLTKAEVEARAALAAVKKKSGGGNDDKESIGVEKVSPPHQLISRDDIFHLRGLPGFVLIIFTDHSTSEVRDYIGEVLRWPHRVGVVVPSSSSSTSTTTTTVNGTTNVITAGVAEMHAVHRDVAAVCGVSSVPLVTLYQNGRLISRLEGTDSEELEVVFQKFFAPAAERYRRRRQKALEEHIRQQDEEKKRAQAERQPGDSEVERNNELLHARHKTDLLTKDPNKLPYTKNEWPLDALPATPLDNIINCPVTHQRLEEKKEREETRAAAESLKRMHIVPTAEDDDAGVAGQENRRGKKKGKKNNMAGKTGAELPDFQSKLLPGNRARDDDFEVIPDDDDEDQEDDDGVIIGDDGEAVEA